MGVLVFLSLTVFVAVTSGQEGISHAFLCSEHAHDRVIVVDPQGAIQWEYPVPHPQDVWMLPNGHVLTSFCQGVREVTRDKKIVWEYQTQSPNEIPNCQPLPDGNVMIGIEGECRLIEVTRDGRIVHELKLTTASPQIHGQFRLCRKTPESTYLVPFTNEGVLREFEGGGSCLRTFPPKPTPVCALRLSEGRTLVGAGGSVTEYDKDLNVTWQVDQTDLPDIQVAVIAGLQRLPNGNTVVCNWNAQDVGARKGAHIFEVTPDKRVVWMFSSSEVGQVASCQLLEPDGTPREDGIIR